MFPLWDVAIAPILRAAGARRIVEIGALRGETTQLMLDVLGEDAEIHVIDPEPRFDATAPEESFGGYHFYRDTSHNVLPDLGAVDAALIDGDHNWYTVFHELRMLSESSAHAGKSLPVLVLHDVGWPYGRRDLYYAPEQIPDEYRQPWRRAGMQPGTSELLRSGGLNPTMCNAEKEGGPRNGVMTAVEDFLASYDRPVRVVLVPVFFGLAIIVDQARLEERPELRAALDRLEGPEGMRELLEVAETTRLRAVMRLHTTVESSQRRLARAADRYLDLLKGALLDEHYLENELRLKYLALCLAEGLAVEPDRLRDPVRAQPSSYENLLHFRRQGAPGLNEGDNGFLPLASIGRTRLDHLQRCLDTIRIDSVPGDLVDIGVGRGGVGIFLRGYLDAHDLPSTAVWMVDEYRATPAPAKEAAEVEPTFSHLQADINLVRDAFSRFDLLDGRVRFAQGPVTSIGGADIERISLLRIGTGIGPETADILEALYPKLAVGGFVVVDDHKRPAVAAAVEKFRARHSITEPLEGVDWSASAWRKTTELPDDTAGWAPVKNSSMGLPLAPAAPADVVDLTVVVVFYNMRREAARTLRSLSRSYQRGIDDMTYEVIVVENGSTAEQRLGDEFVTQFGPEFRYIDLGVDAHPSPVRALNLGIKEGRGENFALMIDGAHVLTPGVLRFGLAGLRTYAPAIVATQQWYVGPGQQPEAIAQGYDQDFEDRLFKRIGWPTDGYRLFRIGHFVGGRDWLDGMWESNCLFVTRSQLEQVGGFDENFSMPGAGFANLDLYERLGASPDVTVVSIIGEGSFHQLHGGVTTNHADAEGLQEKLYGYREQFAELRGRRYRGPNKPIHYVGRIGSPEARRSRPRRLTVDLLGEAATSGEPDGVPEKPVPIPDDLKSGFIEAVWRSLAWQHTTWLGQHLDSAPTDLVAYQQAIVAAQPDWIVELGTRGGGRTLFLASICELVGHGRVLSVDAACDHDRPLHPRIEYLTGEAAAPSTVTKVRDTVGDGRVLVVLGTRAPGELTRNLFARYAPLVSIDSYLIVTDTIVNGNPVWAGFGPGPNEAVKQLLQHHGEFFADPELERYGLTFNPGGFLKRTR